MQLGMIGLGRMGANIVRRLIRDGHTCVVYDVNQDAVAPLVAEGATGATSLADFVTKLESPRHAWIMVPAGAITESAVNELAPLLSEGDTIIDGGNTYYRDDIRRAAALAPKGIRYLDCGTSGGVFGLERGFCLMVGGPDDAFAELEPIFASLAPGVDSAGRTPGREGAATTEEHGYLHCGPAGAGHFVKMVHNGIEYGMMAALAEGLNILHGADAGLRTRDSDAETAPLDRPEFYSYTFDIPAIAEVWRRGSVVESWLLDLTAAAFQESPGLEGFAGHVSDSGEGRWTAIAAIEEGVPADVLTAALYARFSSRDEGLFASKVLSAMRKQFGGHHEKPAAS
jgi:6-phosphogluconate dehydrogenase